MHIEFLVEEQSAEAALQELVPRIVAPEITFAFRVFQGKHDLLRKLPARLRGYRSWLPDDGRIVVLIDADDGNCYAQKMQLERMAHDAGLITRSTDRTDAAIQVLNRLAVQELEAWFFGDIEAIRAAYPGVSPNLAQQQGYRNPDTISGGTWEALERVLQRAGHHRSGLQKIAAARSIASHMVPQRNRSQSFRAFSQGLETLTQMI
jgi:hypothetical protein